MNHSQHEPSRLEIWITLLVGNVLGRSFYGRYVDSLDLRGDERVLDYGSGAGTPARLLARRLLDGGGSVTCVDISEGWQQTARRRLARFPNVEFELGDIASLRLHEAGYDVVFIHFVLHDIPAGQQGDVVQHLARALASRGKLFIREPLQQLRRETIVRLMQQNGLSETSWDQTQVPLMGPTYEGVFCRDGG